MATTITEECIACGACESECPNDAIHLGEAIFVIDADLCSECVGSHDTQMCDEACPIDCCVADPERRETELELFAKARRIHPELAEGVTLDASTSHFRAA